jgi:hypothetical protein
MRFIVVILWTRGGQIQDSASLWWQHVARWSLIFVGPQYVTLLVRRILRRLLEFLNILRPYWGHLSLWRQSRDVSWVRVCLMPLPNRCPEMRITRCLIKHPMTRLGYWGQRQSVLISVLFGGGVIGFASSLLHPWRMTHWGAGWAPGPAWTLWRKKMLVVPVIRLRLPGCPGRGYVTTPAELPRLLFDDLGKYLCGLFCILKKTTKSWSVRSPSHVLNSGHPNRRQLC